MKTYEAYKDRGVLFIGLTNDSDDKLPEMKQFLAETRIPWPNAYNAGKTMQSLGVRFLPTVFVVGRDGRIQWSGRQRGRLEAAIDAALAKSAG